MRWLLLVTVAACTKAEDAKPHVTDPQHGSAAIGKQPDRPVSPPTAKITWSCFHSNMPWGDGQQSSSAVYDLDAATATNDTADVPNKPRDAPAPPPGAGAGSDGVKRTHRVSTLAADKVVSLRVAAAKVLAGGPYEAEYPPSEGTSCAVELWSATGVSQFKLDKARQGLPDAVNALIKSLSL